MNRRDLWLAQVTKTPAITEAERVLCLLLAWEMDDDGVVQVAQQDLAERLGISRRRLTDRIEQVKGAQWLTETRPGAGRRPSTLQATVGLNLQRKRRPNRLDGLARRCPDARTPTKPTEVLDDERDPLSGLDARTTTAEAADAFGPDARTTSNASRSGRADTYPIEEQGERSEHQAVDASAAHEPGSATAATSDPSDSPTSGIERGTAVSRRPCIDCGQDVVEEGSALHRECAARKLASWAGAA